MTCTVDPHLGPHLSPHPSWCFGPPSYAEWRVRNAPPPGPPTTGASPGALHPDALSAFVPLSPDGLNAWLPPPTLRYRFDFSPPDVPPLSLEEQWLSPNLPPGPYPPEPPPTYHRRGLTPGKNLPPDQMARFTVGTPFDILNQGFGMYGDVEVDEIVQTSEDSLKVTGIGYWGGKAGPWVEMGYDVLQRTNGDPGMLFTAFLGYRTYKMQGWEYSVEVDASEFEDFAASQGEGFVTDWQEDWEEATEAWDGDPTEDDLDEAEGVWNDFLAVENGGLDLGDLIPIERSEHQAQLGFVEIGLAASGGHWDMADGGWLLGGRLGLGDQFRYGAALGLAMAHGDRVSAVQPYMMGRAYLDWTYFTLFYWDKEYPGQIELGGKLYASGYINFNNSWFDDYLFVGLDPLLLSGRF